MHSMMGAGGTVSGNEMMGNASSSTLGNTNALSQMQVRLDLMQRMMEQMLDEQQMMLRSSPSTK